MVLTHGDQDHLGGLVEVVNQYPVSTVIEGGATSDSSLYPAWERTLAEKSVRRIQAVQGQRVDLGEPLRLEVLHPPAGYAGGSSTDRNNSGVVLRVSYGKISLLLTADIEAEAEASLLRRYRSLDATVLKVAHHGSSTSSTAAYLRAVRPQVAIVSVGEDNPFGHPTAAVMDRLAALVPVDHIYQTEKNGSYRGLHRWPEALGTHRPLTGEGRKPYRGWLLYSGCQPQCCTTHKEATYR